MSETDLPEMREEYGGTRLRRRDLAPDPIIQLGRWITEAVERGVHEPNAMVLATVDGDNMPRGRTVLLKGLDDRGLAFLTNRLSQKGRDIAGRPFAAVVFPWYQMQRQVTARGPVEEISDEESDRYFEARPRGSQIAAWASNQSSELASREDLEDDHRRYEQEFGSGNVPRPPHWGGYRIGPMEVEFWQGGADRLHDRLVYRRSAAADGWVIVRLAP
jgi:pyridoxamine 5'-phosphate oxidase